MKTAKKFIDVEFKVLPSAKDAADECIIEGLANTSTKDRVGDVVLPTAFEKSLKSYLDNPVLLENHNWDKVAGVTLLGKIVENGLFIRAKISDTRSDLKTLVREGCLRTFSIGYNELDSDFDKETNTKVVKELELLEISIVSVPANPEAKFRVTDGKPAEDDGKTSSERPPAAGEDAANSAEDTEDGQKGVPSCVADKIPKLMDEGYEQEQAIAIAYSVCGEKAKKCCKECGEVKKSKSTIGKTLRFIESVKSALDLDELDEKTVIAICEYLSSEDEPMTKKELIEQLKAKGAEKAALDAKAAKEKADADAKLAAEAAKKAAGKTKADDSAAAAAPAADANGPADSEAPAADSEDGDLKAILKDMADKLGQLADGMAKLLEMESEEADEDESEDAADEAAPTEGEPGKDAEHMSEEDSEKSVKELEAEIAAIEAEINKLES